MIVDDKETPVEQPTEEVEEVKQDTVLEEEPVAEAAPIEKPFENKNAENIRALREAKEKAERERDEYRRYYEEQAKKKQQPEEDLTLNLAEDALAEGKDVIKMQKRIALAEKKNAELQANMEATVLQTKIRARHKNFDDVVTDENLEKLSKLKPTLFKSIIGDVNLENKAAAAYEAIKEYNIYKSKDYSTDKEVIKKNASKPRTVTSVSPKTGDSPLTKANAFAGRMTEERKKEAYLKAMENIKKG